MLVTMRPGLRRPSDEPRRLAAAVAKSLRLEVGTSCLQRMTSAAQGAYILARSRRQAASRQC
jgi:hypothetical protein